jgi:histidyl-tRNA synthetase
MGDVTLMDFLATHSLLPAPASAAEVAVLPVEPALHPAARSVAASLRAAGHRAMLPVEPRKLGTELKRAGQAGVTVAVIVGAEEWSRGELTIRDLRTREQQTATVAQAPELVRELLHRGDQIAEPWDRN